MKNTYSKWLNVPVLAFMLGTTPNAMAQAVIFPQAEQPGIALAYQDGDIYEIANDLLKAKFLVKDGKITFQGCEAMNLLPNSEIFTIKLANGSVTPASAMKLGEVRIVDLQGDANAVRGAERFDGKAIEADYTFGDLSIKWSAILRNGSHYLRTKLDITANKDVKMSEITPMIYTVDNVTAGSVPVTVGNTRGAILASNKIFAGLETPMGLNSTGSSTDMLNFKHDSWNANSFSWQPGTETPEAILKNGSYNEPNKQLSSDNVCGTRGYLTFRESGKQTITFKYAEGDHRLNIVGVDVVDPETKQVVASDYHCGYTGSAKEKNVYSLNLEKAGGYLVRYFVETRTETVTSNGTITYDKKVKAPVLVFDRPTDAKPAYSYVATNAARPLALSKNSLGEDEEITDKWNHTEWKECTSVPPRVVELGLPASVKSIERPIEITAKRGTLSVEFIYKKGYNGIDLAGVDLLDAEGNNVTYDYHVGFSGTAKRDHIYRMNIPYDGKFTLRYLMFNKDSEVNCDGDIKINLAVVDTLHLPAPATTPMTGMWRRNTTLQEGRTWNVSAVVGLVAPGQQRRSVASYVERERAVPWRAFPIYNSWYELNIDRNNDKNYTTNMTVEQCTDVVKQWQENLYKKNGTGIQAFVWDDGWDKYGTWTFNKNFPHGFTEPNEAAMAMESGIGAWLGPVGGYGTSGNYRRDYWKNNGGMQLSNPKYYKVFYDGCTNLMNSYDFRFFKFDGISAQPVSVGPDPGTTGEENAEGIISAELALREVKPDIFFNTSVGTWASPFWFHVTDAVWRQENDWGATGQGNDRERWITYRDRLVYQNFVKNSPLCPINCLMTHGFILTKFGNVSKDMTIKSILNELRCAFACGSGMVELYADYKLLNEIGNGSLWKEIADCIRWQKKNEDVLPDIHWVGGNPWTGSTSEVYGWASWNGRKATLALRNGKNGTQTYTTTLREALEIPAYIKTSIKLTKAFKQNVLNGLEEGKAIDIDEQLTLKLPPFSVFVFDGEDMHPSTGIDQVSLPSKQTEDNTIYDLSGRRLSKLQKGVNIVGGKKIIVK